MVIHDCTKKLKLWGGYHIFMRIILVRMIKQKGVFTKKLLKLYDMHNVLMYDI